MSDDIIEVAFNSLWTNTRVHDVVLSPTLLHALAEKVVAAVTPLSRAAALEEAAQVAEKYRKWDDRQFLPSDPTLAGDRIAAAIRALKEQP